MTKRPLTYQKQTKTIMKLKNPITKKANRAGLFLFVIFVTGIYSCFVQAQVIEPMSKLNSTESVSRVKNTQAEIKHAANLAVGTRAVAVNHDINGGFTELKPALSPNGNRLYFSRSEHPDNFNGVNDLEDIWYSEFDATTNAWSHPTRMAGHLNNQGPNFINNVSVTGDTLILGNQYGKKGKMRAGLSYSVNVNGEWSFPTPINIKNDYNVSDHSNSFVSLKSGIIIRAVQRETTFGDRDLYVSFWNGAEATEPLNMGSVINTELEESSPFLDADTKTLYFASRGHHGHGGMDIWVTKRLDDTWTNWSEPQNLGPAVNGKMDDEFFSITHSGNYAIFSKQVSVHNVDLYRISIEDLYIDTDRKPLTPVHKENSSLAAL
jgi:OmpA-OmpF porin, OOP family